MLVTFRDAGEHGLTDLLECVFGHFFHILLYLFLKRQVYTKYCFRLQISIITYLVLDEYTCAKAAFTFK